MGFAIAVENDVVRVTMSGVLTRDALVALAAAAEQADDGSGRVLSRIADMRGVTEFKTSFAQVGVIAAARTTVHYPNAFRTAILVSSRAQAGIAHMYRTLNDNPSVTIEVFEDEATALRSLRSPAG